MNKLFAWIIIFLVVAFALGWISLPEIFSPATITSSTTNTNTETTIIDETTAVTPTQENLCIYFQPVIMAGDLQGQCATLGGTWVCQDDFVGCTGAVGITCSGPAYTYAFNECTQANANYLCDDNHLICYYGDFM